MQVIMRQAVIWGIIVCFCAALFPGEALAAKHDKRRYDTRHERVVINMVHIQDRQFNYARTHRLTLRDLIVAKAIADESRSLDTEDVLRLMRRGQSHRSIAKRYHVKWKNVDRRLDDVQRDMRRESLKLGLTLWALDEIIN